MRPGDFLFRALTTLAAAFVVVLVVMIVYEVLRQAWPAIQHFGISFVWTDVWNPIKGAFGAWQFIVGTVVSAFFAVLLATPLSIAIALFLTRSRRSGCAVRLRRSWSCSRRSRANAILILTIMIVPIVSAITRELFLHVPKDLKEGALGLGTTRWEAIRGVVIPYCAPGSSPP